MNDMNGKKFNPVEASLSKSKMDLPKYDMYCVTFKTKSGESKRIRVFCDKGFFPDFESDTYKKLQEKMGENIAYRFFVERLLGSNGLMQQQGRDDFIYLGSKEKLPTFEKELFFLKLQLGVIEERPLKEQRKENQVKKGKTYVVADIHGMWGSYAEVINRMSPDDHLVILGDVIDRGPAGIKILQDIIRRQKDRKNNPKITFMLGNHEMQFIESMAIMIQNQLQKEDLQTIIKWNKGYGENIHEFEELKRRTGLTNRNAELLAIWLVDNKGSKTVFDFLVDGGRVKDANEQNEIFSFLCNSYVAMPLTVNNEDYLLVHAMPPKDPGMIKEMKITKKGLRFSDLKRGQYSFMLEERDYSTYEQAKKAGFKTICGHTPDRLGEITKDEDKGFVRIDAGCGYYKKGSKLALYCIDDDKVEFIDEKESLQEPQL